jgi:hypothetical protein
VEGGFAVPCRCEDGTALPLLTAADLEKDQGRIINGILDDGGSSLILTSAGASGIVQLSPGSGKGDALKPDSNTNLMFQRSIIPTVKQEHKFDETDEEIRIVAVVFAISWKHVSLSGREIWRLWNDRPVVKFGAACGNSIDEIIIA